MTKQFTGQSILVLISLFFIGTGLTLMFSPATMLSHMFIAPIESSGGLSSIRALWGGTIVTIWATALFGAIKTNLSHIFIGLLSLVLALVGRIISLILDGSFPELIPTLLPTIIAILLMLIACKLVRIPENN